MPDYPDALTSEKTGSAADESTAHGILTPAWLSWNWELQMGQEDYQVGRKLAGS